MKLGLKLILHFILAYSFTSNILAQSLEDKIDAYMQPLVASNDFYGAVLIASNGQIVLRKGYGLADIEHNVPNTPENVFHIASVNKPLTAIGVMLLHQRGLIDIDSQLIHYLPDYPLADKIKVKHLLSQTSGIPSYNSFPDYSLYAQRSNSLKELVDWFKVKELLFKPGEKYEYSNCNFVLLAYLIEKVTSMSYEQYMSANVLKPAGMTNTAMYEYDEIVLHRAKGYEPANNEFDLKPIGYYNNSIKVGSGAYYSTLDDLYNLDQALYGNNLLNESTKERMFTSIDENEYGLGWGIWKRFDKAKHDHDGTSAGSVAYFSRYPDDRVTIIFLGNINSGVFQRMKYDLAAIYFNKEYSIPVTKNYITLRAKELKQYEGRYQFENGNFFDLKLIEDDLRFLWRGRGELGYLLSPLAQDKFFMRARGDQINFESGDKGDIKVYYVERSGTSKLTKIE